jgi:hypothetical protein
VQSGFVYGRRDFHEWMSSFPLVGIVSGRRNLRGGFRGIDAIGFVVAMRNFGLRRYFEGMERRESIHWRSGVDISIAISSSLQSASKC